MVRDLWPGVTPRQILDDFTPEQIGVLMHSEDGWREAKEESGGAQQSKAAGDGIEWVSGDSMFRMLSGMN